MTELGCSGLSSLSLSLVSLALNWRRLLVTPDVLVSLEWKNQQPKEKALQGFRLLIDSGEVYPEPHQWCHQWCINIICHCYSRDAKWKSSHSIRNVQTLQQQSQSHAQRLWCLPHAECAVLEPGLQISLGTGRQRGRSSKMHCSVPQHKSR